MTPELGSIIVQTGTDGGGNPIYSLRIVSSGSPVIGGSGTFVAGTTKYYIPFGTGTGVITDPTVLSSITMPSAATISKLYVNIDVAAGAAKSVTLTVYKNGVATALTCAVSGASATSANDGTHSFTVAAGDLLSMEIASTALGSATLASWGFQVS